MMYDVKVTANLPDGRVVEIVVTAVPEGIPGLVFADALRGAMLSFVGQDWELPLYIIKPEEEGPPIGIAFAWPDIEKFANRSIAQH